MKRSYDEMSTVLLPVMNQDDSRKFKSTLEDLYKLRVVKIQDISKPAVKPIDDIDEPENEDEANETRLNKNNARMLQMDLKDSNGTEIRALETQRLSELDDLTDNWYLYIQGPVVVRCGNMMLEKRNVTGKVRLSQDEIALLAPVENRTVSAGGPVADPTTVTIDHPSAPDEKSTLQHIQVIDSMAEDWDEGEDDCIIIE